MINVDQRRRLWRLRVSANVKVVAALLADLQSLEQGWCTYSLAQLAVEAGMSRSALVRTLAALQSAGALVKRERHGRITWHRIDLAKLIGRDPESVQVPEPESAQVAGTPEPESVQVVSEPGPESAQVPGPKSAQVGPGPEPKSAHGWTDPGSGPEPKSAHEEDQERTDREAGSRAGAREAPPPAPMNELAAREADLREAKLAMIGAWSIWEREHGPAGKAMMREVGELASDLVAYRKRCPERSFEGLATASVRGFLAAKRKHRRPRVSWLAEDVALYIERYDEKRAEGERKRRAHERVRREEAAKRRSERELAESHVSADEAREALAAQGYTAPPRVEDLAKGVVRAMPGSGPVDYEERRRELERQREHIERQRAAGGTA